MNEMYNKIENLCEKAGVNVTQMCRDAKIPRGNLTDLKKGRTAALSTKTLTKISSYFSVPIEYFLGAGPEKEAPALPKEDELKLQVAAYWGGGEDLSKKELDDLWEDAGSYFRFKMKEKKSSKDSNA